MRNCALFAALALALGIGVALADHAVDPATRGDHAIEADQTVQTDQASEIEQAAEPTRVAEAEAPDTETVAYGITREVCTVSDWGLGEVRRECVTEVLPPRGPNPALAGICMTKYGVRTCY